MDIPLKRCIGTCGKNLPLSRFYKCPDSKDGLQARCKKCQENFMKKHEQLDELKILKRKEQRRLRNSKDRKTWGPGIFVSKKPQKKITKEKLSEIGKILKNKLGY